MLHWPCARRLDCTTHVTQMTRSISSVSVAMRQTARREGWGQRQGREALHAFTSPTSGTASLGGGVGKRGFLTPGLQALATSLMRVTQPRQGGAHFTCCVDAKATSRAGHCTIGGRTSMALGRSASQARCTPAMNDDRVDTAARWMMARALMSYNPTLHESLVTSAAKCVAVSDAMRRAQHLLHSLTVQGSSRPAQVVAHFAATVRAWQREEHRRSTQSTLYVKPTSQTGVVTRWGSCHGTRLSRVRAALMHSRDVQVSEVLPDGRVVTLNHCPPPDSCVTAPLRTALRDLVFNRSMQEQQRCQSPVSTGSDWTVYLHFVLYKEAVDLGSVFAELIRWSGDLFWREDDFAVNQLLDERAVTVQLCSVRCTMPAPVTPTSNPSSVVAADAECLTRIERWAEKVLRVITRVNILPVPFVTQPLAWQATPCGASEVGWGAQYAILLRDVYQQARDVVPLIQRSAEGVANYYPAAYFGHGNCPFYFYHATAALERGRYREAMIIVAVLSCWSSRNVPRWVTAALTTLVQNADAPSPVMREWWLRHVPPAVRTKLLSSKTALLWNVLASCRLHELDGPGPDGVVFTAPAPGDFVRRTAEPSAHDVKVGSSSVVLASSSDAVVTGEAVRPLYTRDDAAAHTVQDVVLPLVQDGGDWGEKVGWLARRLGFASPCPVRGAMPRAKLFRALFVRASGRPRCSRPWVRELVELPCLSSDTASGTATTGLTLLTDLDFVEMSYISEQSPREGCPSASPLRRKTTAPLSWRGHSMTERLPKRLNVISRGRQAAVPGLVRRGPTCLALNFTLPADCCWEGFVAQFAVVRDERSTPSITNGYDNEVDAAFDPPRGATGGLRHDPSKHDGVLQGHEAEGVPRSTAAALSERGGRGVGGNNVVEGNVLDLAMRGQDAHATLHENFVHVKSVVVRP